MFGLHSHRPAPSHTILAAVPSGDPERRRGLQNFLVWPFLLGAAFFSDDLSATAHATGDGQNAPSLPNGEETHAPSADTFLDPVKLADWGASDSNQTTQNLLPEPHLAEGLAPGELEHPVASNSPEGQPLQNLGPGGSGSPIGGEGAGLSQTDEPVQSDGHANGPTDLGDIHLDIGSGTIEGVIQSVAGTAAGLMQGLEDVIGALGAPGENLSPTALLSDVGHAVESFLGASSIVGDSAPQISLSISGPELSSALSDSNVIGSAGTIAFGVGSPESSLPEITVTGSYTDFGVALQTSVADGQVALTDHADAGAPIDLGQALDHHDQVGSASTHLADETHLCASMDLLG